MQGLLPIGSIVKLKNSPSTVMVIGYFPVGENKQIFNYMGTVYPAGIGISDEVVMFDGISVDDLLYVGYQDEQAKGFCEALEAAAVACFKKA